MNNETIKVSIGTTRLWDAFSAGKEVARSAISDLDETPDFVLLFSTIHYEKNGGFEAFLSGVWSVLPKGTCLVGGTVAGFSNNHGCYTRGATALAVSYKNMDIAIGVGHNTKREPKKAGKIASDLITEKLIDSEYKNKFLFSVISGPTLPRLKYFGTMKIIDGKFISKIFSKAINLTTRISQIGLGRESEVLEGLCKNLNEYALIGISSNDDNKYLSHYQFCNDKVYTNSIVAIGISIDMNIFINTTYGLKSTGKKAKITRTENWNYIIKSLEGTSPVKMYFEKFGISKEVINVNNIHRITPFLPLGCYHSDGTLHPYPVASFLGDYLLLGHDIVSDEIEFLSASGASLLDAVNQSMESLPEPPTFMIISSCAGRLETLGKEVYRVRKQIMEFTDKKFIILYGLGEEKKESMKPPHLLQESFNVASFY